MNVQTFVNTSAATVPVGFLSTDMELVQDIQARLIQIGLLDPPIDSNFGPVSINALDALCMRAQVDLRGGFTNSVARALMEAPLNDLFPLRPQNDFAGVVVRAMLAHGFWIGRHPDYRNIVYIEGCDVDGTPNDDARNKFNDARFVITVTEGGTPTIIGSWDATSEPSKRFTLNPMDPDGAARIAFGQYKSWTVGIHKRGTKSAHEALLQATNVTIFRDLNKDFEREGDKTFTGVFGINHHWGFDLPKNDLGTSSAGCLVGRTKAGHRQFMALLKEDPRFVSNNGYRFMATVMHASDLQASSFEEDEDMATVIKINEEQERQLWLYTSGQRRPFASPHEIEELRAKGLLDNRETELSRATFEAIPIMPGVGA